MGRRQQSESKSESIEVALDMEVNPFDISRCHDLKSIGPYSVGDFFPAFSAIHKNKNGDLV